MPLARYAEIVDAVNALAPGFIVTQLLGLSGIMRIDDFLDRLGTGHRRLGTEQRSARAEGKPGDMPEGREQGRAHAPRRDQRIESFEMALFLFGHPADWRFGAGSLQDRELSLIDPYRAMLPGVIDPDHCFDHLLPGWVARQASFAGDAWGLFPVAHAVQSFSRLSAAIAVNTAAAPEARKL